MAKQKRPKPSGQEVPDDPKDPVAPSKPKRHARTRMPKPSKGLEKEKANAEKAERLKPSIGRRKWEPNARDLEIYGAYAEGDKTQRELAAEYRLANGSIHEIIHKVESYLSAKYIMEIRQLRVLGTERLQSIYAKAIQSYKRSLEDEVTVTTEPDGETTERRRGQAGSAALLSQAREAISDLMDLWGAKAPKSIEVSEALRVGGLSPLEAIQARIQRLQELEQNVNRDRPDSNG